jgi:serine protease inhibitor
MRLSAALAAEMAKQPRDNPNIVISPASIAGVMALLDIGADTKMRGAIWDTLGFKPALGHDATSDLAALRATITTAPKSQKPDEARFDLANVVMFDPTAKPYDKVVKAMRATGAEVSTAPLADVENIRRINRWVAEKTQNFIPGILAEQPLPPGVVAVNALYFKGLWPQPFDKNATKPQTFHMVAGETQVPMMHAQQRYGFRRDGDFAAVEMPYRGGRYALVVLTNTARSLPLQEFAPVTGWLNGTGFSYREVSLSLPRFTLEASEELLEPLKSLGLRHGMDSVTAFENLAMLPQ